MYVHKSLPLFLWAGGGDPKCESLISAALTYLTSCCCSHLVLFHQVFQLLLQLLCHTESNPAGRQSRECNDIKFMGLKVQVDIIRKAHVRNATCRKTDKASHSSGFILSVHPGLSQTVLMKRACWLSFLLDLLSDIQNNEPDACPMTQTGLKSEQLPNKPSTLMVT